MPDTRRDAGLELAAVRVRRRLEVSAARPSRHEEREALGEADVPVLEAAAVEEEGVTRKGQE